MKLIGFNFSKIGGQRSSSLQKDLKINTKVDVSDVVETKTDLFSDDETYLTVNFKFDIFYEPEYAAVSIEGSMLISVDKQLGEESLKLWKDKKVHDTIDIPILNAILRKSTLKALQIEEELGLPFHIQLPSVKKDK